MKKSRIQFIFFIIVILSSCVQKSNKKTVVVKLTVNGINNVQSVGVRGQEKPLSWKNDLELKPIVKDSLYTTAFSLVTGYKFTEIKFTLNGQLELNDKENRKIKFRDSDTTFYEAIFDIPKE